MNACLLSGGFCIERIQLKRYAVQSRLPENVAAANTNTAV